MDANFFDLVDKLLTSGGHVGIVLFLWIGLQASQQAKEAVRLLRTINSNIGEQRREQREDLALLKASVERLADNQANMDRDLVRLTGAIRRG